jgi:hypothetical protein
MAGKAGQSRAEVDDMTIRESIAKAIFNEMAKDSAGSKKLYWETAPKEVKDYCLRLADVAIEVVEEDLTANGIKKVEIGESPS